MDFGVVVHVENPSVEKTTWTTTLVALISGWASAFIRIVVGIILVTSYSLLFESTMIYTDQTMSLFCLIAFIFFFSKYRNKIFDPTMMAGIFSAVSCFTKLPAIALLLFFIAWIVCAREWPRLKRLLSGLLIGSILVVLIYILTYGFDSLQFIISHSVYSSASFLKPPIHGRSQYVFYVLESYIPIFISLVIFLGAYRNKTARPLFFASMAFVAFSLLMGLVTDMYVLGDNYLYPLVIFTSIGLGMYVTTIFDNKQAGSSKVFQLYQNNNFKLAFTVLCLVGTFVAFKVGIEHYTTFLNLSSPKINQLLFHIYPVVPMCIIGLMVLIEYSKSRTLVLLFILLVALWCPAYNGASAYSAVSAINTRSALFYKAPLVFNEIPAKQFSVYVESWNSNKSVGEMKQFYAAFFNEKYPKVHNQDTYDNVMNSIYMVTNKNDLPKAVLQGNSILTDVPDYIKQVFPAAEIVKNIPWESGYLYLMELNLKGDLVYQSDYSSLTNGTHIVAWDEPGNAPLLPTFSKRGDFVYGKSPDDNNAIRVTTVRQQLEEQKHLKLGYSVGISGTEDTDQFVTICANLRTSCNNELPEQLVLYVQDFSGDTLLSGRTIAVQECTFAELSLTKVINKDASWISAGIDFTPKTDDSWFEISDIKIYTGTFQFNSQ